MRFKCHKTEAELYAKVSELQKWHPFFPLFPRKVNESECVWLETIERRYPKVTIGYYSRKVRRNEPEYRFPQ